MTYVISNQRIGAIYQEHLIIGTTGNKQLTNVSLVTFKCNQLLYFFVIIYTTATIAYTQTKCEIALLRYINSQTKHKNKKTKTPINK